MATSRTIYQYHFKLGNKIVQGVGLELSDSRGLVKSQDTFDVGRCQTVRSREEGVPRIGV